jgi:hypothetical protein
MAMSKKDFELVAGVLRQGLCSDGSGEDALVHTAVFLIHEMAAELEANYPAFKKDVFLMACGVTK